MKVAVFKGKGLPLSLEDWPQPRPERDQVLIRLKYAALNHRDLWVMDEQVLPAGKGIVLGSDGAGVVEAVGAEADQSLTGEPVIINPSLDWGPNPVVQGDSFRILGFPDHGTFAEYILISGKSVFRKPAHLSFEEAAALPLSGLTAYRALFSKARLRAEEKVLITGIGGGAALWALQFAVGYRAKVYVTSGSDEKLERAKQLGALAGFNYKTKDWMREAQKTAGGFDVVIDSAGGSQFSALIELALPGGRIVNFGRTAGNITDISTRLLYWKQISIHGTTMGTRDEFMSLLEFMDGRRIRPVLDETFPLSRIHDAFARMQQGGQFGKILLDVQK